MKLSLCVILYILTSVCAISQIERVEMSVEDYNLFLQDTKDKKALQIGFSFLKQENKEIKMVYRIHIDSLQREIDQLNGTVVKLEKQVETARLEVEKANLRADGYKSLNVDLSHRIAKLKKLMSGCCEIATLKIGGVVVVLGAFVGGIFWIMKTIK